MFKKLFMFKKGKKGFTLIELLAVIVILAIIMALIIPEVTKTIEKSQIKSVESSVRGLMRAVDIAQKENAFEDGLRAMTFTYENGNETSNVGGLNLDYTGKKPRNGTIAIGINGKMYVALYDGKYCIQKNYDGDDIIITKNALNDCGFDLAYVPPELLEPEPGLPGDYPTDVSGANHPELLTGMEPIIWDATKHEGIGDWVVPSDGQEWYNYGAKQWANARTIDDEGGVAYWVWIPRYAYQIEEGFHQTTSSPIIKIKFLNGTGDKATDGTPIKTSGYGEEIDNVIQNTSNNYFLHQAFDFSNDGKSNPIPGFWVAKFEPSMSSNKIRVVPNENSVASKTVSEFYTLGLDMKTYICNGQCDAGTDTHMMKNIEWGAVAYLSQSEYGINGKVIRNQTNYTGGGQDNAFASGEELNQSTTGTIYGIYDMSGGKYEYVMGNYFNGTVRGQGSSGFGSDGFPNIEDIPLKYINLYSSYANIEKKYGDAIWETSSDGSSSKSWHSEESNFISSSNPWLFRGGYAGSTGAGVFFFGGNVGDGGSRRSFRPVALR